MAGVAPIAKAAGKKVVKHEVSKAKHRAGESKPKSLKEHHPQEKVSTGRKPSVPSPVKKTAKRMWIWGAPNSYAVRRAHNLLVVMWLVGTLIIMSEFFANKNPIKVWKQLFAFQFLMFVLSLFVMIDSLAEVIAGLSVLIVIAIALVPGHIGNIVDLFQRFSNIAPPSVPAGATENSVQIDFKPIDPLVPRTQNTSVANPQPPSTQQWT